MVSCGISVPTARRRSSAMRGAALAAIDGRDCSNIIKTAGEDVGWDPEDALRSFGDESGLR